MALVHATMTISSQNNLGRPPDTGWTSIDFSRNRRGFKYRRLRATSPTSRPVAGVAVARGVSTSGLGEAATVARRRWCLPEALSLVKIDCVRFSTQLCLSVPSSSTVVTVVVGRDPAEVPHAASFLDVDDGDFFVFGRSRAEAVATLVGAGWPGRGETRTGRFVDVAASCWLSTSLPSSSLRLAAAWTSGR